MQEVENVAGFEYTPLKTTLMMELRKKTMLKIEHELYNLK